MNQLNQDLNNSPEITSNQIREWLVTYISDLLEIDSEEVDEHISFDRYGLDSSAAIIVTGDLSQWLGRDLEPTLLYDYPTISELAEYLTQT
jgi:acyl carrier protein